MIQYYRTFFIWYRGFIQGKTRIMSAWIFVFFLGVFSHSFPKWPGIFICFLGASLRFWASGYLRKDALLAVGGPYAYVRNPLYLGTYLMIVGASWSSGNKIFLFFATLFFACVYHYIILDEEVKLKRIFENSYILYCGAVPRFFPNFKFFLELLKAPFLGFFVSPSLLKVNPDLSQHRFSYLLAKKNKAYEAYFSFLGLIGWIVLSTWIWNIFLK